MLVQLEISLHGHRSLIQSLSHTRAHIHTNTQTYKNERAYINKQQQTKSTVDYACQNRFSSWHKSFKQRRQNKTVFKKVQTYNKKNKSG